MPLNLEVKMADEWTIIAIIGKEHQPGSFSNHTKAGREVYLFQCNGDHSEIYRSVGGVDIEVGEDRRIFTKGLDPIMRLESGQTWELNTTNEKGEERQLRFTHI